MNGRRIAVSLALATSAVVAFACGGSAAPGTTESSACDDYFDAFIASYACGAIPYPASEVTRLRPRFESVCNTQLTLPGTGLTPASLEACAKQAAATPCGAYFPACIGVPGTLAAGASCVDTSQCATNCEISTTGSADGGAASTCGVCQPAIAVGQPCGAQVTGSCLQGSVCTGNGGASTCVEITYGALGVACDDESALCGGGLVCNIATNKCASPGASGTACDSNQACATGLACIGGACAAPIALGATCELGVLNPCASGLACDPTSSKCIAMTWTTAGEACSSAAPCLVGYCNLTAANGLTGTCPKVIADGQACPTDTTATCDTFASCTGTVCAQESADSCK